MTVAKSAAHKSELQSLFR